MTASTYPKFIAVADHGLLVEFSEQIDDRVAEQILSLDHAIAQTPPPGVEEVIPGLVNLLVVFDPLLTDHAALQNDLDRRITTLSHTRTDAQIHEVQICYDTPFAPDLEAVASQTGLSPDEVVSHHLGSTYRVGMYGFAPGYAYMTGVAPAIQVPRKPTAVRDVPAGSVIIAGPQCLVTTLTMPTGWMIIGRSPTRILQNDPDQPFLFNVGDHVRFKRMTANEFSAMNQEAAHG